MALIVIAADKGAPGVTTTALALAAVWPRPVLLAECDPAGGDLVYRFPAADGSALDPRRGLLNLAVAARRGLRPGQLREQTQTMSGGLNVLTGVINAEQGAGLGVLWGPLGQLFAALPGGDVIADCGRLGPDGPQYDLLAQAAAILLVTRPNPGDVIRLRDRVAAVSAGVGNRGRRGFAPSVLVIADQKTLRATAGEVAQALGQGSAPASVLGGIAHDLKGAELLRGEWGGRLDKTLLIRTARETAQQLSAALPADAGDGTRDGGARDDGRRDDGRPGPGGPGYPPGQQPQPPAQPPYSSGPPPPPQYPPGQQSPSGPQYPPGPPAPPYPSGPSAPPGVPASPGPSASPGPPVPPVPSAPPYPGGPPAPQGRHSASAQPGDPGNEAGDGRWITA
jgi:hypothetical protein